MIDDTSLLLWGMLFGSIGLGFFIYGKRQRVIVPLVTGIVLSVFPFFITDVYWLVITGIAITAVPYFIRI